MSEPLDRCGLSFGHFTFSQANPVGQQRPRTVEIMAGNGIRCAWALLSERGAENEADASWVLASAIKAGACPPRFDP
jgi:hypothetical protein